MDRETTFQTLTKRRPLSLVMEEGKKRIFVIPSISRHTATRWQQRSDGASVPLLLTSTMASDSGEGERLLGQNPQYGSVLASPLEGAAVDRSEGNGKRLSGSITPV